MILRRSLSTDGVALLADVAALLLEVLPAAGVSAADATAAALEAARCMLADNSGVAQYISNPATRERRQALERRALQLLNQGVPAQEVAIALGRNAAWPYVLMKRAARERKEGKPVRVATAGEELAQQLDSHIGNAVARYCPATPGGQVETAGRVTAVLEGYTGRHVLFPARATKADIPPAIRSTIASQLAHGATAPDLAAEHGQSVAWIIRAYLWAQLPDHQPATVLVRDLLPAPARDLAALLGDADTLALLASHGGQRLEVPATADSASSLADHLGSAHLAARLLHFYAGEVLALPAFPDAHRLQRDAAIHRAYSEARAAGAKVATIRADLAERYGLSRDRIARIVTSPTPILQEGQP